MLDAKRESMLGKCNSPNELAETADALDIMLSERRYYVGDSVPRSYDIMQIYISDGGGNVYGPYPYGFGGTFELIEMLNEATLIETRRGIAVIMPDSSIIGIDTKGHVECREEDETDNKFKVVREFDIEPEQYRRLIGVTAEIVRDRIFSKGDFYMTLLYCGRSFDFGDCDSMREFFDILGIDYPV